MAVTPRSLRVLKQRLISPNLKRITFVGDDLADFSINSASGYVKIFFDANRASSSTLALETNQKTVKRSFTIRAFRENECELDIDFVLHDDYGPASIWSNAVTVGDVVSIVGPGPTKLVDQSADWFAFFGDLSALPAIAVNLEKIHSSSVGFAFLQVPSIESCIDLEAPSGVEICWVVQPNPKEAVNELLKSLCGLTWMEGNPYIWVAGEFELMRGARKFLKSNKKQLAGSYISSYWKFGATQEGHRKAKFLDAAISKVQIN
jgi:NADPH-dependent ferric siderophore reductase